eukprot:scaffold699_cov231-Pinguiococcus_pyrenoidosus.AAC.5
MEYTSATREIEARRQLQLHRLFVVCLAKKEEDGSHGISPCFRSSPALLRGVYASARDGTATADGTFALLFFSAGDRTTGNAHPEISQELRVTDEPVPEEASKQIALYDMVYVERLGEDQQSAGGVFLPKVSAIVFWLC